MIPDTHGAPGGWGIQPVLFSFGGHAVSSYSFFVGLGLIAAVAVYYYNTRGKSVGSNALYIALAAAIGGILGAKLPIWIANLPAILAEPGRLDLLLSGRTIVGGIIGGALAVRVTKHRLGITQRLGNYLVPSLAIGIFFGRIGCYLAGCCYGIPTSLGWGADFGDAVLRHPTQLYEAVLMLAVFAYAQAKKDDYPPGLLFRLFMIVYFGWRFLVEFVRVSPPSPVGLSYYQVVSLGVVGFYAVKAMLLPRGRTAQ